MAVKKSTTVKRGSRQSRARQSTAKSTSTQSIATRKPSAKKTASKSSTLKKKVQAKKSTTKPAAKKPATKKKVGAKKPASPKTTVKRVTQKTSRRSVKKAPAQKASNKSDVTEPKQRTKQAQSKSILYLGHATRWNFQQHLYEPLRASHFSTDFNLILPHETSLEPSNTRSIIENANVMLAEVSYPSTGLGIELGWAEVFDVPIIAFYQEGRSPNSALKLVVHDIFSYETMDDLIEQLSTRLRAT